MLFSKPDYAVATTVILGMVEIIIETAVGYQFVNIIFLIMTNFQ